MIYSHSVSKEEEKYLHRRNYELEKEELISVYKKEKWPREGLKRFLINSLKKYYEQELREDGFIK